MKITFRESGGFAGRIRELTIDLKQEGEEFSQLWTAADLPPEGEWLAPQARDLRLYEIETAGKLLVMDERSIPSAAKPLINWLRSRLP